MPKKYFSRNQNFNPLLIISNIGIIFSISSIVQFLMIYIFNRMFGISTIHRDQLIGSEQWDLTSDYGYVAILATFFNSVIMIEVYVLIIDKANQILDYVLTNFFLYLVVSSLICKFPVNLSFWIINGLTISFVTLIAEYISLKLERKEIRIHSSLISGTAS